MGTIRKNENVFKYAIISAKDTVGTEIVDITTSSPFITAEQVEMPAQSDINKRFRIKVSLAPGLPDGNFSERVTARSNLEKTPEAVLQVSGRIVGDVEVRPTSLTFLLTDSDNQTTERTMGLNIINNQEDKPLEILDYRDLDGHLELELKVREEGRNFELRGTLKESEVPKGPRYSGKIKVITNHPEYREITIDYHVVWRRKS